MATKRHRRIKYEIIGLNSLVLVFIILLLSYTFIHTGAVLARYINPPILGYMAAGGVEGLIMVLSWRRAFRAESTSSITFTLATVLVISAIANLYEGYAVKEGQELTVSNLATLDPIQAVVGMLVTFTIPFLVFKAGEVMGSGLEELGKFISDATGNDDTRPAVVAEQMPVTEESKPVYECEYCHSVFDKPQTRSAHLRYCETYKATKLQVVAVNGNGIEHREIA